MDWTELLARLLAGEITADEFLAAISADAADDDALAALEELLVAEGTRLQGETPSADVAAQILAVADAVETVRVEQSNRESALAEVQAEIDAAAQRIAGEQQEGGEGDPPPAEGDPPAEGGDGDPPPTETETDPPAEGDPPPADETTEPEPVTAATTQRTPIARLRQRTPASRTPAPAAPPRVRQTITAAADVPEYHAGQTLPDGAAVARGLLNRWEAFMGQPGGAGEKIRVARVSTEMPDDRRLLRGDVDGNFARINAVVAAAQHADLSTPELEPRLAAGGFCGPPNVYYGVEVLGDTAQPVRGALPQFGVERGRLQFRRPPTLADLPDGIAGVWTEEDDLAAAADPDNTALWKQCIEFDCIDDETVKIEALYRCFKFRNFQQRSDPETAAAWMDLARIWYERFKETRLLTKIAAASTDVTHPQVLGVTRDLLYQVGKAAARMRNFYRLDPMTVLRVMFPAWLIDMMAADLALQLPGENSLAVSRAEIVGYLQARNVAVTFFWDGEPGQILGAQGDGVMRDWPETVVWYLFPEGTFVYADDGNLDIGLVRDLDLIRQNAFVNFFEEFGNVWMFGNEALRIESTICADGSSASTADSSGYCTIGS